MTVTLTCTPVKLNRLASTMLICASVVALSACGDEATETTAGSSPGASPASTSAAPSSPAAASMSDKEICEAVKKAGDEMKELVITAAQSGKTPTAAEFQKMLTDMQTTATSLASSGGEGPVTTAMKQLVAEVSKAATAADPMTAADNPAYVKAGADLTAACKTAGVNINF